MDTLGIAVRPLHIRCHKHTEMPLSALHLRQSSLRLFAGRLLFSGIKYRSSGSAFLGKGRNQSKPGQTASQSVAGC
jgi:hypothetical protein